MVNKTGYGQLLLQAKIRVAPRPIVHYLILAATVVIAAVLRFYKLGEWSFWRDEYITVSRVSAIFGGQFHAASLSQLATYVTMGLWGVSEWSARLPAALVGVGTLPVLYFLVRKMFNPAVALLAGLLLAVSPWHIYWSQNARFYTPLLLFFSMALVLFHYGLEEDRPRYLILSAVFFGLALLERMLAAFLLPILVSYVVMLKVLPFSRPSGLRLRNLALHFGLSLSALLLVLWAQPRVRDADRIEGAFSFVNNHPAWILAGIAFYVGLPLLCVAVAGAVQLLAQRNRAGLLLSLAAVIPPLAIALLSLFVYTANRYAFISLTSVIILAAVGTKELLRQAPKSLGPLAAGFAAILLLSPMGENFVYFQYHNGNRDDWKGAFALIASLKQEGEIVVTTHREMADYYLGEKTVAMQVLDTERLATRAPRTWFVADLAARDKAPKVYRWILANAQLVATLDVTVDARTYPMRIYLYDPERPPVQHDSP